MKHNPIKNNFKGTFYKTIMPFIYNVGAAIVIFGAMFKLLNLPGGSMMLGIGLSTEALIFLLSAFEPKEQEIDWTRVYPELTPTYKGEAVHHTPKPAHSITQKLDDCLQQAQIDAPLLDRLAASMRCFSENISSVPSFSKVNEVTEAYIHNVAQAAQVIGTNHFSQIEAMTHTLTSINALYKNELTNMQEQTTGSGAFYSHLATTVQAMEVASNEVIHFKKELALLNEKVTALNEIYAKTLTAFRS